MIIVKSIGYQTSTAQAAVEYDLGGEVYSFTVVANLAQLVTMSVDEIKTYIVDRVASERNAKQRALVEAKLDGLVGVDLEG